MGSEREGNPCGAHIPHLPWGVWEGKCMLDQESPTPALASLHLLAESESRASTLGLTECRRLAGPQRSSPYHSPTSYTYARAHTCTHTPTHMHTDMHTHTHSLTLLWKPRAGEPAAAPTICLPNFFQILPPRALSRQLWGDLGGLEAKA